MFYIISSMYYCLLIILINNTNIFIPHTKFNKKISPLAVLSLNRIDTTVQERYFIILVFIWFIVLVASSLNLQID